MKRLPVALVLGLVLELVIRWAHELQSLAHDPLSPGALVALDMAHAGAYLASLILVAIGLHDLSLRTTHRSLRVAFGCALALIAAALFEVAREAFAIGDPLDWWFYAAAARWLIGLGLVIAIAVAAYRRAQVLAIAAVAILGAVWVPSLFHVHLLDLLPLSALEKRVGYDLIATAGLLLELGMLAAIDTTDATPRPALALDGLSLAVQGYYLRIAGFAITVLLVVIVLGKGGSGADDVAQLALYGGFVVNAAAFGAIGFGALRALRSAHEGLDTIAMGVAACANLWCAGAMLNKLAVFYRLVHGGYGFAGDEVFTALDLALPIVATIGGVVLTTAIAQFARGRGDAPLATSAAATGVGYAMLMIASTGIANYVVASSFNGLLGVMLTAAVCGLVSQVILGRLCRRAEDALADGAALPTATVV